MQLAADREGLCVCCICYKIYANNYSFNLQTTYSSLSFHIYSFFYSRIQLVFLENVENRQKSSREKACHVTIRADDTAHAT